MTRPDYLGVNRAGWDENAPTYAAFGEAMWAGEPVWGIWSIAEADVGLLPDVAGHDTVELGCGTGYVSAWLARRGARPVGVDLSPAQLSSARRFQRRFGIDYPLIRAAAEDAPLPAARFDLVISEYGAALWSDPYRWVPEAARLLRPGGRLVFLTNAPLVVLCMADEEEVPADDRLKRPYFGLRRTEWADTTMVEFHLAHGEWIELLRANGFEIERLVELRPPPEATTSFTWVDIDWARQWPSEEAWVARLPDQ